MTPTSVITKQSVAALTHAVQLQKRVDGYARYGSRRLKTFIRQNSDCPIQELLLRIKYPGTDTLIRDVALKILKNNSLNVQDDYLERLRFTHPLQRVKDITPEEHTRAVFLTQLYDWVDLDRRSLLCHRVLGTPWHRQEAKKIEQWLIEKGTWSRSMLLQDMCLDPTPLPIGYEHRILQGLVPIPKLN